MDIGDVEIVVQYKATCELCTLWQRFGRAARSSDIAGTGILLVEKKDTTGCRKISAGSKRAREDSQGGSRKRQRYSKPPNIQCTIDRDEGNRMDTDSNCQGTLPSNDAHSDGTFGPAGSHCRSRK